MDTGISQTTVSKARDALADKFFPGDKTNPDFIKLVNEVLERFYTRGFWRGAKSTFRFPLSGAGNVFLPVFLDSIISHRLDTRPSRLKHETFEFLYDGPGEIEELGCSGVVVDRNVSPIPIDYPETPGNIRVVSSDVNDAGAVVIVGADSTGKEVTSGGVGGESISLSNVAQDSAAVFSSIKGIQKETTQGFVTIQHVVDGTVTDLVVLEPSTTHPIYRKYYVDSSSSDNLIAYCKRRFCPVYREEDYILPGNLSALKLGMYAINYEEENDLERSDSFFRKAEALLNNDVIQYQGNPQPNLSVELWGPGVSKIKSIN